MKNIVILGSGFGGLRTAINLEKKLKNNTEYKIILVDKNTYQTYTPSLYEIAAAYSGSRHKTDYSDNKFAEEIAGSASFILKDVLKNKNIELITGEVEDINLSLGTVFLKSSDTINYDYLVIALGAETAFYNIEGANTCCHEFKNLHDALRIRQNIEHAFERASQDNKDVNVVVIGGGLSGFEVATEVSKYCRRIFNANPNAKFSNVNVRLIESSDNILKETPRKFRRLAKNRLEDLGIKTHTNMRVKKVEPHQVTTENGEVFPASVSIWAGGVQGRAMFKKITDISLHEKNNRILSDDYLRVKNYKNVFAIGDSVYFDRNNLVVPATAWAAEQEADTATKNVLQSIKGAQLTRYKPKFPGFVSAAGGKYGIAHLYGITFAGFTAWAMKRLIDLKYIFSIYPVHRGLSIWFNQLDLWSRND